MQKTSLALAILLGLALASTLPEVNAQQMQLQRSANEQPVEYAASFKNTDITEFIQVVGRNLGRTIIIDPDVRGRIDVRSYDVMNEQQYWQFFLRSEEHTSELQSRPHLVCRLLLEKKKVI